MNGNKIIREDIDQILASTIDWKRFSGKTVLITGANGFLPSYMVESLLTLNQQGIRDKVKVFALVRDLSRATARFRNYLKDENLTFLHQDVCDPVSVPGPVDFIIHAASQASPRYYGQDPVGTLNPNIIGTYNLLRLAEKAKVESFLYFSSSEVYGSLGPDKTPTGENDFGYLDPAQVRACYAESKRMGETMCVAWHQQFGVPVRIVRPFHTYGPGMRENDGRVFADFVMDIVKKRDIVMRSDGLARRAFCYLSDATIAFFLVLLHGVCGEAYNVGNPDAEISVGALAERLVGMFDDRKLRVIREASVSQGYIPSVVSRISPRLEKIGSLGWKPTTGIEEGFTRTILSYE